METSSEAVHGWHFRLQVLRGSFGGGVLWLYKLCEGMTSMPGSNQHAKLVCKSLLEGCGQKFQRSSIERLMPKQVKKRGVRLSEQYLSSKFHNSDVKSASAYAKACYHAC